MDPKSKAKQKHSCSGKTFSISQVEWGKVTEIKTQKPKRSAGEILAQPPVFPVLT